VETNVTESGQAIILIDKQFSILFKEETRNIIVISTWYTAKKGIYSYILILKDTRLDQMTKME
jgi:hypothetical protein